MSESDFEQAADVTQYGAWRAQQYRAHLEQAAANAADLEGWRPTSDRLRASQQGLFSNMSPTDMGEAVQSRAATVGQDFGGQGRPLEARGGTFRWADISDSPAPVSADMRNVNTPGRGRQASPRGCVHARSAIERRSSWRLRMPHRPKALPQWLP